MPLSISQYLQYANLQMAAEAFIRNPTTRNLENTGQRFIDLLVEGNKHSSLFTKPEATKFASEWEVLDQEANTSTGFSGTLFKNRNTDQIVISFRSTEFIDDSARDNQATNAMEIKDHGYAFGQIRDMEAWYQRLKDQGHIGTDTQVAVTGYSLGGHLATVFNALHRDEVLASGISRVGQVVTFNAAGVGGIAQGKTLSEVMQRFDMLAKNADGQAFLSGDARVDDIYLRVRTAVQAGGTASATDKGTLNALLSLSNSEAGETFALSTQASQAAQRLLQAIARIDTLRDEVARLQGIAPTNGAPPVQVPAAGIGQFNLDYQLAVVETGKDTGAANLYGGFIQAIEGKVYGGSYANQFDVVGDAGPSAVANSQWHYGTDVPVFIARKWTDSGRSSIQPDSWLPLLIEHIELTQRRQY